MKNYIQRGDILDAVATAAVQAGDVVEAGSFIGVAITSAAIGEKYALDISNVFELPKDGSTYSFGASAFWDGSQIVPADTATSRYFGGVTEAAAGGDATIKVRVGAHIGGNLINAILEMAQKLDVDAGVAQTDFEAEADNEL